MEGVAAASLAASLALAALPEGAPPPEIGNGLNERHRVIKALQVGAPGLELVAEHTAYCCSYVQSF
jgi:hypothetical protein